MTLSQSRIRLQALFLVFFIFVFYCIYSISTGFPTTSNKAATDIFPHHQEKQPNYCKNDKVTRNTDPNHTKAHLDFWRHLGNDTVYAYRKKWQAFMTTVKPMPVMKGKGIVFVAGNRDTFQRTITSIKLLRKYDCKLNIEVWHLNDEQPGDDVKTELGLLGAVPRDLSDPNLARPIAQRRDAEKQFQIKAAAVINSGFKEVLYLDSDNVPVRDPTFLFSVPSYKSTGALFWPDFWKTHGDNKIFDILNIPCIDEWEQESGQMVIDKQKSWLPLQLAWYMQKHYDIYFQFLNGDKDTFKYAWKALDVPYHMIEALVGMAGNMVNGRFCGHTMLQYAPTTDPEQDDNQILFVHSNLLKITDKNNFIHDNQPEHPWDLAKHSTLSYSNTWIKPEFYIGAGGRACMDFTHREGEPDATTENFDSILPDFQKDYFSLGGIGGETR